MTILLSFMSVIAILKVTVSESAAHHYILASCTTACIAHCALQASVLTGVEEHSLRELVLVSPLQFAN